MKSRKPANESSLLRSGRQPSPLARPKPPVMSAPFDHLYACHLTDTTPLPTPTASRYYPRISPATEKTLTERLNQCSKENRMLKNLLLVNLDLVQQQSDRIVSKEKALVALKSENATLKSRIERINRKVTVQRPMLNPPPLVPVNVPTATQTSKSMSTPSTSQVSLNKYTELLITDNRSTTTTIVDPNLDKTKNICYLPTEGEYLHLPETDSSDSSKQKNYFYPKDELTEFLNLSDINSLLKASDSDFTKSKNCLFTADDEFLLDVTSLDNEDIIKSTESSFGKNSDFLHIPELTAADRLKETLNRQKMNSGETQKKESKPKSGSRGQSSSSKFNSLRTPSSIGTMKAKTPLKLRPTTVKTKADSILPSQFYKSRNIQIKTEPTEKDSPPEAKTYDSSLTVNRKSKMIHTYSKTSRTRDSPGNDRIFTTERKMTYTGSLSDRLKLIDTTPTGEDPYQLGEADMREQSPIPRLMLQKNNPNKTKIFCGDNYTCTSETLKLLDSSIIGKSDEGKAIKKIKLNKYNLGTPYMYPGENDDDDESSTDDDKIDLNITGLANVETQVDMQKPIKVEASMCDFSYGENSRNIASRITFENNDYSNLFSSSSFSTTNIFNQDLNYLLGNDCKDLKASSAKEKEAPAATKVLIKKKPIMNPTPPRGKTMAKAANIQTRKRASSSCGSQYSRSDFSENVNNPAQNITSLEEGKGKGKAKQPLSRSAKKKPASGKKTPPPPMTAAGPYHTILGDSESSWFIGRDPDYEPDEDLPGANEASQAAIEVPRWREKIYTSCYSMEGTENLDDEIFNKRHHKRELDEKRRKRWDLQRQREQLVVERLRRRQQDAPWYQRASESSENRPPHTLNRQPRSDIQYIEIVDELPVSAFGEMVPAITLTDFYLPWVRSSNKQHNIQKRAMRNRELKKK